MSAAAKRLPPAAAWALGLLAAFLLYLLSGPVVRYTFYTKWGSARTSFYSLWGHTHPPSFDLREANGRETFAILYTEPYRWVARHTPLRSILRRYDRWWENRLLVRSRRNPV